MKLLMSFIANTAVTTDQFIVITVIEIGLSATLDMIAICVSMVISVTRTISGLMVMIYSVTVGNLVTNDVTISSTEACQRTVTDATNIIVVVNSVVQFHLCRHCVAQLYAVMFTKSVRKLPSEAAAMMRPSQDFNNNNAVCST